MTTQDVRSAGGDAPGVPVEHGDAPRRCGFVAVLGAPNVGKSTLVNHLVGTKVSIVSPKVQTTRTRVLGIVLRAECQLVLVDTPGIFVPRRRLDRAMVSAAWSSAGDADAIVLIVDSERGIDARTGEIIARLKEQKQPAILAINKIDRVAKPSLLSLAADLNAAGLFSDTFMISALKGEGIDALLETLLQRLPRGPWLFPEDEVSDMPNRLLAAEITREKLYLQLQQELPYACAVETERWTEEKGSIRIDQVIYVERPSQKAIVIGRSGSRIKSIGTMARTEIEELLERRVHLFLHVKVQPKWTDDPTRYQDLGLDFNA